MSNEANQQEYVSALIDLYRRRLQSLEMQNAHFGRGTPPEIMMEIEDIQAKIQELNQRLHGASKLMIDKSHLKNKLKQFFNLKEDKDKIKIYVSRHSSPTLFPIIDIAEEDAKTDKALQNLYDFQSEEAISFPKDYHLNNSAFTVVSALEMIEAIYLRDSFLRINSSKPSSIQTGEREADIQVNLDVCPDPKEYTKILGRGTFIFIGGPRANLGTYYYLYGKRAGEYRLKRTDKNKIEPMPKDQIKSTPDSHIPYDCDSHHNLAIIQKCTIGNSRTIIYLAGTGVSGTAAAVDYFRESWSDSLYDQYKDKDFCKVIRVARRKDEDISRYMDHGWEVGVNIDILR